MQKVITINLNGNAYQLDEAGYEALLAYLNRAQQQLAGNPDRDEIVADLEQAIAEKCLRVLGANKTVVTAAEIAKIIDEMGPVEGAPGDAAAGQAGGQRSSSDSQDRARRAGGAARRLYTIRDGAMIAGVCNGVAAFAGIDVTIVRIIFLVLAVLTRGFWVLVYFVLMFVIPSANTSEEQAAAFGEPFNAQELVDRAKRKYAEYTGKGWKPNWDREWMRNWRRERREQRRQARYARSAAAWWPHGSPASMGMPPPVGYAMRIGAGFMVPIFTLLSAACFWILAYTVVALVTNREAFGTPLPPDVPLWVGLLVVGIAYNVISWPLHATKRASYHAIAGYNYGLVAAWDGLMSASFAIVLIWLAYHYVPEVRLLVDSLPSFWDNLRDNWNR